MEKIKAEGGFVSGFLCAVGLLTAETGFGILITVVGCAGMEIKAN